MRKRTRGQKFLDRVGSAAPFIAAGIALFFLTQFFSHPLLTKSKGRVFTEGVTIHIDRASPAFAALEDVLLLTGFDGRSGEAVEPPESTLVQFLAAGMGDAESLAKKVLRDNRREESLFAQARASREREAALMAQAATDALKRMARTYGRKPESNPKRTIVKPHVRQARKIASVSESRSETQVYRHPEKVISLTDLKMSREDLARELLIPLAASLSGEVPTSFVASNSETRKPTWRSRKSSGQQLGGLAPRKGDSGRAHGLVGADGVRENSRAETAEEVARHQQLVVSGPIEFAGGLAITSPNQRIVVYREVEGQKLEEGSVWVRDGRYEIFLSDVEGSLIAELRTPYDESIGRGFVDLHEVRNLDPGQYRYGPLALKISPVPQGITGRVATFPTATGKTLALSGAEVSFRDLPLGATSKNDGRFEDSHILEGSTAILSASKLGYWPTQVYASAGFEIDMELLPEKAIEALARKAGFHEPHRLGENAVLFGRVVRNSQPVQGAVVEILTANESTKAIYFNEAMKPDPSLERTSKNGLYAFLPVTPGSHAVQASVSGEHVGDPEIVPIGAKTVARVDLETSFDKNARIRVFDAFRTDWPLAAQITNPAFSRSLQIPPSGEGRVEYAAGSSPIILDADAGESYERVRISPERSRRSFYFPMIRRTWLSSIRGRIRLNQDVGTGTIVGFVQGSQPYKVALEEKSVDPNSKLLYFNSQGVVSSREFGEPGGGFIIFNVPEGFRHVKIQPAGTSKFFAATVLVESKVINVINHSIR